jgi:hypothetical protein
VATDTAKSSIGIEDGAKRKWCDGGGGGGLCKISRTTLVPCLAGLIAPPPQPIAVVSACGLIRPSHMITTEPAYSEESVSMGVLLSPSRTSVKPGTACNPAEDDARGN